MESLLERLIQHYGISKEDYFDLAKEPSFSMLPRIDKERSVITAIDRINRAIEENEKILIYGDYDTDGIMATSIMAYCFKKKHKAASTFIPSRYQDGYGLNDENAKRIAASGYGLVILVDNGVSCLNPVSYLLQHGVETIIIDHHELPSSLPPATSIIHPSLLKYGDYAVSAGYLSAMFSVALLGYADEYLLTLGAISTISDQMPLKGYNRVIAALALRYIRKYAYPQICLLTEKHLIDEKVLSMEIIPALNAVGRLEEGHKGNRIVNYFASDDGIAKLSEVAAWLQERNKTRKEITANVDSKLSIDPNAPGLFVTANLLEGMNGLVANRLLSQYNKPVAVFSPSKAEVGCYVGSIRSKEGFNVMEFEDSVSSIIKCGGGHAHAGGLTVKRENLGPLKEAFLDYCKKHPFVPEKRETIPLMLGEINMESYRLIRSLGPYGQGWEEPEFLLSGIAISTLMFTPDGRFLSMELGANSKLFSFSYGKKDVNHMKKTVDFRGRFAINEYRGKHTITLYVEEDSES